MSESNQKKAFLKIEDESELELPIYSGSIGPDVIDISQLTPNGRFTFDPGFVSTASCESQITFIDGGKGVLLHRGYPIEQLAKYSSHLETCYLLIYGELPTSDQKKQFEDTITRHTMVHEQLSTFSQALGVTLTPWQFYAGCWCFCQLSITILLM